MSIYASTSCLGEKNLLTVLDVYKNSKLLNIELGSNHLYVENLEEKLVSFSESCDAHFLVHNYFPPAKDSFIFNLSSQDPAILRKSIELAKNAINLCSKLGSKLYTFHAGFRAEPDMSFKFSGEKAPYDTAFNTFVNAVNEINSHAEDSGVKIGVENNVSCTVNSGTVSDFLLMQTPEEFKNLFERLNSDNVGLLLDVGHLNVSSFHMKFDKQVFFSEFNDKILEIHVHENNGQVDTHDNINLNSWFLSSLNNFCNIPIVLESTGLSIEEIKKSIEILAQSAE